MYIVFGVQLLAIATAVAFESPSVHLKQGNLALRTSQQPAPLFGFGQFLVDKGNIQLFGISSWQQQQHKNVGAITPRVIYGFTERLTAFADIVGNVRGFGDFEMQAEYLAYKNDTRTYVDKFTFVGALTWPTDTKFHCPTIGFGAPSAFAGVTVHRRAIDWYYWLSPGVQYVSPQSNEKRAWNILYQAGLGRNVYYKTDHAIVTLILEFLGLYRNAASTNNTLFLAPTFWFSTYHFTLKAGVSCPVLKQGKGAGGYSALLLVGWTFN